MKFSQFEDRQKFELEVAECISYLNKVIWHGSKASHYVVLPKLNILIRTDADVRIFLATTAEYKRNKRFLTRVLSFLHITLVAVALKLRLCRFFLKVISLEASDFYPVIIGGNNRLRFVDSSNSNALLVAKNGKSALFTKNAMRAYCTRSYSELGVIPSLLRVNDRVYLERQIPGLAINRLVLTESQEKFVDTTMSAFFLIQKSLNRTVSFKVYMRYKTSVLVNYSNPTSNNDLVALFVSIGSKVEATLGSFDVSMSPAHGDLNRGNIFLHGEILNIIDWEYFMYRHVDYDETIYKNNLRHQTLSDYQVFFERSEEFDFDVLFFLIEELWFRILNFKADVSDSQEHVDLVASLINKKLQTSAKK